MLHALGSDQAIRKFPDIFRGAFEDQDFEAGVVVEMGVRSGHHQRVVFMLQIRQFFWQQTGMMIIDQRHGTDDECIRGFDNRADQAIANEVTKRLGAVGETLAGQEAIEALKKVRVDCHADATERCHRFVA